VPCWSFIHPSAQKMSSRNVASRILHNRRQRRPEHEFSLSRERSYPQAASLLDGYAGILHSPAFVGSAPPRAV
jgi:hypothetical protein